MVMIIKFSLVIFLLLKCWCSWVNFLLLVLLCGVFVISLV